MPLMRILLANTLYPSNAHPEIRGGAETFSKRLCEALVGRGHSVKVVRCGPVRGRWETEKTNGVEIATLPVRNVYSPWQNRSENPMARAIWHFLDDRMPASPEFDAILDEFRPDVLHSNVLPGLTTGLWSRAKARGIPIVHTLHDYYLTCVRSLRFNGGDRCASTCTSCRVLTGRRRSAAALVDAVVSVSDRTLAVHRENGVFTGDIRRFVIRNPPPKIDAEIKAVEAEGYLRTRRCLQGYSRKASAARCSGPYRRGDKVAGCSNGRDGRHRVSRLRFAGNVFQKDRCNDFAIAMGGAVSDDDRRVIRLCPASDRFPARRHSGTC
jgi:glycosyltransferase involved in cell wall biosynthesis